MGALDFCILWRRTWSFTARLLLGCAILQGGKWLHLKKNVMKIFLEGNAMTRKNLE